MKERAKKENIWAQQDIGKMIRAQILSVLERYYFHMILFCFHTIYMYVNTQK